MRGAACRPRPRPPLQHLHRAPAWPTVVGPSSSFSWGLHGILAISLIPSALARRAVVGATLAKPAAVLALMLLADTFEPARHAARSCAHPTSCQKSKPSASATRASVRTVGFTRPASRRCHRFGSIRAACAASSWVSPASARASRMRRPSWRQMPSTVLRFTALRYGARAQVEHRTKLRYRSACDLPPSLQPSPSSL